MLSASITQMLDRVGSDFGIHVDVLDAALVSALAPDRQPTAGVLVAPEFRSAALAALRDNRSSEVGVGERTFRLVPFGRSMGHAALLVVTAQPQGAPEGLQGRWLELVAELLRTTIEAEIVTREEVHSERQQNRAMRGVLRFLQYVLLAGTEREVADAVIHAAAVWFDVDARLYRRDAGNDFRLYAALPGAQVGPADARLTALSFPAGHAVVRITSSEVRAVGGSREGVFVPIWASQSVEWVLALLGSVPTESELTLGILGRVLGAQMERLESRRSTELREKFEEVVGRIDRPTELTALEAMRQLVWISNASSAALWVRHGGELRRIAGVGTESKEPSAFPEAEHWTSPTRHVRSFSVGDGVTAHIDVHATEDVPFAADAESAIDTCAAVLKVWLSAVGAPTPAVLFDDDRVNGFVRRIEEELARARRFDRRLALVLVRAEGNGRSAEQLDDVVDVLRRELRGSDVLGMLDRHRIVALLVETDAPVVASVVRRLRDRLGRVLPPPRLAGIALGEAALSTECATVDALLSRAEVNAQTFSESVS